MRALEGLSKPETLLLVEIERFVETGDRVDGLQVTDEWIDEAIKFLTSKLRPKFEAFSIVSAREDAYCLVHIETKKALRLWKRGERGEKLDDAFRKVEARVKAAEDAGRVGKIYPAVPLPEQVPAKVLPSAPNND